MEESGTFLFNLRNEVRIKLSGLVGTVEGRAEYTKGNPPLYQVYHLNAKGDAEYNWYNAADIERI